MRLRAVVLGLNEAGTTLAEAIAADPRLRLVGVADLDAGRAAQFGERHAAAAFRDPRSALVETGAQLAAIALPAGQREDYVRRAVRAGAAVVLTSPPSASLEAALALARCCGEAAARVTVTCHCQFEPAYLRLRGAALVAGGLLAASAEVTRGPWPLAPAHGLHGVLLDEAYDLFAALVGLFGIPEDVLAVRPRGPASPELARSEPEATAVILLRFAGPRAATLIARRGASGPAWRLLVHGSSASLEATPEGLAVRSIAEGPPAVTRVIGRNPFAHFVGAVAAALSAGLTPLPSSLNEHLLVIATIEAAYLSITTGAAESPARLLELAQDAAG